VVDARLSIQYFLRGGHIEGMFKVIEKLESYHKNLTETHFVAMGHKCQPSPLSRANKTASTDMNSLSNIIFNNRFGNVSILLAF
jgi:hypothetical protein